MTDPHLDADAANAWLTLLHGHAPNGLIHICSTGDWAGQAFTAPDAATGYVERLDREDREGIYARVTTLKAALPPGRRGGATDTQAIPALWADLDLAGPGHAETNLPPDENAGRAVIAVSGLPAPTLWIHSGGGLYPIWLLEQPHVVTDDDFADVKDLAAGWQNVIGHTAERLGWRYGTGVGDLARVLRIPGTINRKAGLQRPCAVLDAPMHRYTISQLYDALARTHAAIPSPTPTTTGTAEPHLRPVPSLDGALSPGDDYNERGDWLELLNKHGWTVAYQRDEVVYLTRPGKRTGISATINALGTGRLHVFTTNAEPLEAGCSYSKHGTLAALEHGGDHKKAAQALKKAGYGRRPPLAGNPAAESEAAFADILGPYYHPKTPPSITGTIPMIDGNTARVINEPTPHPMTFGPSEDGLARALVAHHGNQLRFCPERQQWLRWSGHKWAWDTAEHHRELIRALSRELPDGPDEDWRKFKRRALSAAGVSGTARLAQTDSAVVAPLATLDGNPWEINTPDGIVDLTTGQIRPTDPAALHTRSASCAPDLGADSGRWQAFLADTFADNTRLIAYLQRLVGYSAVGMVGPHVLPFAHGSGGNGKGVFLEAVAGVLGDYATTAPVGFLMATPYAGHETEIARLAGARMVICSEVNEDDRFDESRVKQLTGGDTLTARFMRQDHFTFRPSHQLWLMGNHKPAVRSGGRAFWRRLRLIPFEREVPEDKMIDDLQGILVRDHGPALLAWIAAGAAQFHAQGLREPEQVKSATREYEHDQDTVARFVEDRCKLGGGDQVKTRVSLVRDQYERWCATEGETPVNAKAFGMALVRRYGVTSMRTMNARLYAGITLLGGPDDDPDAADILMADDRGRYR